MKKLAWNVQEASEMAGISKSYIYKLIYGGYFRESELNKIEIPAGRGKRSRAHYIINKNGMKRLTGLNPDVDLEDYLEDIAKRIALIMRSAS